MIKKLIISFSILLASIFFITACSDGVSLEGGPKVDDPVYSNNSKFTIQKGNYLYFTNGLLSYEELAEGDNDYGNVKNSAIYRQKLDDKGNIELNEDGEKLKPELLASKVVGYENGGMYIYEDKLYFATPTNRRDRTGEIRYDLVDFYSINLDGSNPQRIYETSNLGGEGFEFKFINHNNSLNLYTIESSELKMLNIAGNDVSGPFSISENIETFEFDIKKERILYTRELRDSDKYSSSKGNLLVSVNFGSDEENVLIRDNKHDYSIKAIIDNILYYTRSGGQ